MRRTNVLTSVGAILLMVASSAQAVTFQVGSGKTYATIQSAVDAAVLLDVVDAPGGVPNPDPVRIEVFAGQYNEVVNIPKDPGGSAFNTANDGWTMIGMSTDVWVNGGIVSGGGRDSMTFDGINVKMVNASGYFFNNTSRQNTVKNAIIYNGNQTAVDSVPGLYEYDGVGDQVHVAGDPIPGGQFAVNNEFGQAPDTHWSAIRDHRLFGFNWYDHLTIYDNRGGFQWSNSTNTAGVSNVIVNGSKVFATSNVNGNANPFNNSNVHTEFDLLFPSATNCNSGDLGGAGDCSESYADAGGNVNYSAGQSPSYWSTDPSSPYFLWLSPDSPSSGTGDSAGRFTNGDLNMGARPTFPEPATLMLFAPAALVLLRRRSA
jgi:hypothetical protein